MSPLGLAWRSLRRQPARAVLGIAGVVAVGALLFDMLMLSRGLFLSFRDLLEHVGYDVRVTATEAIPGTGPVVRDASGLAASLRELPEIDEVVPLRFGNAWALGADDLELAVTLTGSGSSARRTWSIVEGENLPRSASDDPAAPAPLVINRILAERLDAAADSAVELQVDSDGFTALPPLTFRVAGIAEFSFAAGGQPWAATTLPAFSRLRGEVEPDTADLLLVASAPGVESRYTVAAIRARHPGLNAFSNAELVGRFQDENFAYFRHISVVLTSVTLFFAFILVTTLLTVSVNQRFGEIAGLRAIGFARRRVALDLLCESALLVGAGGALSLPVGAAVARVLDGILRGMPGLPERLHFFVFEPWSVVEHVVLLSLTGVLAAAYPVWLAARLPIAATLRDEVVG